jgi:hypothetical protein
MKNIQKVSFVLRMVFQSLLVLLPIMLLVFWVYAPYFYEHFRDFANYYIPSGIEILHPLTAINCVFGFLANLLPTAVTMTILFFLIRLFKLYEKGEIFAKQNAKYIHNIALVMLIGQGVNFIYEALISLDMTFDNPAGKKVAVVTFGTCDIYNIITAVMLLVVSWIMLEAAKLQEEHKYIV